MKRVLLSAHYCPPLGGRLNNRGKNNSKALRLIISNNKKLKLMKKYFYLAAAAITLVACNQKEMENDGVQEPKVINLTASINSGEDVTRASSADDLQNTQFVANEQIFVEAYETGESTAYKTGTYTTGASGALTADAPGMYYPANNGAIDICAYYPKTISSTSTEFTVGNDQQTAAGYRASDLMYATKLTNQASTTSETPVDLTFNHALAKIIVNITLDQSITSQSITQPTITAVKIKNTVREATLSISGGDITASKKTTGEPAPSASDINITGTVSSVVGHSNMGIIVPQQVAAGNFIEVTYDNRTYTYELPNATTFQKGKVYTYAFTLTARALRLDVSQITDLAVETGECANTGGSHGFTL